MASSRARLSQPERSRSGRYLQRSSKCPARARCTDFADIMDSGKVFIANLANGNLGPGHADLLVSILVSSFSNAAARRGVAHAPGGEPDQRTPFFLHVDEIENFITDTFGDIV